MHKIVVIDDHKLFSSGLSLLFNELNQDVVVKTFVSLNDFIRSEDKQYSVIILDFYLPGSDFLESISFLKSKYHQTPIVVVSASPSPPDIAMALSAGAKTFIGKNTDPEHLLSTISSILDGSSIPNLEQSHSNNEFEKFGLSCRQTDVIILVSKGYSNKEIAAHLDISPETVKTHLKAIFKKFGVQNRIEAIELMRQFGMIL